MKARNTETRTSGERSKKAAEAKESKESKTSKESTAPEEPTVSISALEPCEQCPQWKEVKRKIRFAQLLTKASEGLEKRLKTEEIKPTLGDYLKLLQMQKELEEGDAPKEIKVTWVDPTRTSEPER